MTITSPEPSDGRPDDHEGEPEAPEVTPTAIVRPSAWGRTFAALKGRDYAWYFTGNVAFFLGMQMNIILRGFLAYDLTEVASSLGVLSLAIAVPMLTIAPFGGVVADWLNKRTLLMAAQSVVAVINLTMAVLILADLIQFWHLLTAAVGTGALFAVIMPARQALVPQLVPQQRLMNAISLQMGGMNLTRIIGPAIAGLLIAPIGMGWVYAITVVLFSLGVMSLFPLPKHGMVSTREREGFKREFSGGFRYIWSSPLFRLLITTALIMPLFALPVQQILPVFAEEVYDGGSVALGVMAASTGVGGLIGALIAANLDSVEHKGRIMLVGSVIMGVSFLAFAWAPTLLLALLFLATGNVGSMLFMTTNNTVIQAKVPEEIRGRVMSVLMMSFGLQPLGVVPVTVAADLFSPQIAVGASALILLVLLTAFFTLSPRLRNLRLEALAEAELSPAQAATLVAEGKLTPEEAARKSGASRFEVEAAVEEEAATPRPRETSRDVAHPRRETSAGGRGQR